MPKFVGFVVSGVAGELQQEMKCYTINILILCRCYLQLVSLEYCAGVQPLHSPSQALIVPWCFFIMAEALPQLVADARSHPIFHLVPKEERLMQCFCLPVHILLKILLASLLKLMEAEVCSTYYVLSFLHFRS